MDKELFFGTNILNKHPIAWIILLVSLIPASAIPRLPSCGSSMQVVLLMPWINLEDDEHSREGGSSIGISNTLDDLLAVKLDLASMSSSVMVK